MVEPTPNTSAVASVKPSATPSKWGWLGNISQIFHPNPEKVESNPRKRFENIIKRLKRIVDPPTQELNDRELYSDTYLRAASGKVFSIRQELDTSSKHGFFRIDSGDNQTTETLLAHKFPERPESDSLEYHRIPNLPEDSQLALAGGFQHELARSTHDQEAIAFESAELILNDLADAKPITKQEYLAPRTSHLAPRTSHLINSTL